MSNLSTWLRKKKSIPEIDFLDKMGKKDLFTDEAIANQFARRLKTRALEILMAACEREIMEREENIETPTR